MKFHTSLYVQLHSMKYPEIVQIPLLTVNLSAMFCGFSFLLGLPFGMQNGQYLVDLFDNFSANFPLMMVAFFEVISVAWVYGINR